MYYVIYCEDRENTLEIRRSVRPAHLLRLEILEKEGRLLLAGPLLKKDGENPFVTGVNGSLIIADFANIEDAKAWAAADPYATAEVYANISVHPFKKVLPA